MTEIKVIKPDTDISQLKITKLDWDMVINKQPYQVIRIDGYCHCIGGLYGDNNYWCYPLNEEPTYENLVGFNGEAPTLSIKYERNNRYVGKHNEFDSVGRAVIYRNDKEFYSVGGVLEYALPKALAIMATLWEHPLGLAMRDFDKKLIGRKVWYRSEPGIIKRYCDGQGAIIIEPDGIDRFSTPKEYEVDDDWIDEDTESIKVDIFEDGHIWWFRDK